MSSESLEQRVGLDFSNRERFEGKIDIYVGRVAVLYTPPPLDPNLMTGYDIRPLERVDLSPKPWEMPEPWKSEVKLYEPVKLFEPKIETDFSLGRIGQKENSPFGLLSKPDYLSGGIERIRKPEYDDIHGNHMNYETLIPGIRKPISNIHIDLDDI